jgi:hypothetical protein
MTMPFIRKIGMFETMASESAADQNDPSALSLWQDVRTVALLRLLAAVVSGPKVRARAARFLSGAA